jgi:hypothetical protein
MADTLASCTSTAHANTSCQSRLDATIIQELGHPRFNEQGSARLKFRVSSRFAFLIPSFRAEGMDSLGFDQHLSFETLDPALNPGFSTLDFEELGLDHDELIGEGGLLVG